MINIANYVAYRGAVMLFTNAGANMFVFDCIQLFNIRTQTCLLIEITP